MNAENLAKSWLEVQKAPVASWKYSTGVALTEISRALLVAIETLEFIAYPISDDECSKEFDSWQSKNARDALAKIRGSHG